ncbi:hypothetical protein ACA910_016888 [Epithemia clementina (nom. ined.)]
MASHIGGDEESRLLDVVKNELAKRLANSPLLSQSALDKTTKLLRSEIIIGNELGQGAFNVVSNIDRIALSAAATPASEDVDEDFEESPNVGYVHDRKFMAKEYVHRKGGDNRYCIKVIKKSARDDANLFVKSMLDLVIETYYLSVLQHPNIINMRAISAMSPYQEGHSFFVIMDKLEGTLSDRLDTCWKLRMRSRPRQGLRRSKRRENKKEFFVERLRVAYDVSKALVYVHSNNIAYRDLKPQNIGFDKQDNVKLFDFGQAWELKREDRDEKGTVPHLGVIGSMRYMAPELALAKRYNESCDVYSFAILLWEILKVERPLSFCKKREDFVRLVIEDGWRPRTDSKWPAALINAMKIGRREDLNGRPTMAQFSELLRNIIFDEMGYAADVPPSEREEENTERSRQSFSYIEGFDSSSEMMTGETIHSPGKARRRSSLVFDVLSKGSTTSPIQVV